METILNSEQPQWRPCGVPHAARLSFEARQDRRLRLLKPAQEPDLSRLIDLSIVDGAQSQASAGSPGPKGPDES